MRHGWVVVVWGLVGLFGCPARPVCDLSQAGDNVQRLWPDAEAARRDRDLFVPGAVWYWSHGVRSVDGYGVTMVLLEEGPGVDALWDHVHHVQTDITMLRPNLLFFDQKDGPRDTWEVIGFGYGFDYTPCVPPVVGCIPQHEWMVHEAGYHRVPLGDGGMTLATDDDLSRVSVSDSVDPFGCEPVYYEDLSQRVSQVRHGRMWSVHAWIPPEGGEPVIADTDPWARWRNAPDRVAMDEGTFFHPSVDECDCEVPEPFSGGCAG